MPNGRGTQETENTTDGDRKVWPSSGTWRCRLALDRSDPEGKADLTHPDVLVRVEPGADEKRPARLRRLRAEEQTPTVYALKSVLAQEQNSAHMYGQKNRSLVRYSVQTSHARFRYVSHHLHDRTTGKGEFTVA